jgi:hypothetical protein
MFKSIFFGKIPNEFEFLYLYLKVFLKKKNLIEFVGVWRG